MVVHSRAYFWIAMDSETGIVTVATTAMHAALNALWQDLQMHVHMAISTEMPQMTSTSLWVVPLVLEGGYCVISIWGANQRTRYHLCRAVGGDLEVWNGLVAFFWELPGDYIPTSALTSAAQQLEVQTQLSIRRRLAQGGRFAVLRYDRERRGEAPALLSMVFNRCTLEQLRHLLSIAFAEMLRQPRQELTFYSPTATLRAHQSIRPSPDGQHYRLVWQATMCSEDGARYLVVTNWPFFYIWDGVLADD